MRAAMPSLSSPSLSVPPGLVQGIAHAYQPPLIALGVALLLGLVGRALGLGWLRGVAGAVAAVAGWAALVPTAVLPRAVLTPRAMVEFLLLPGVAVVLAGLVAPWLRGTALGRAERWLPAGLSLLVGWWLAGSAAGRPEFWRVWLAVVAAAWLLARGTSGPGGHSASPGHSASRVLATALALWGGLLVAGAPPVWLAASLVIVAAALAAWVTGGPLPSLLVVTAAASADLGAGRLARAGLTAVDLACLLAIGAAWLASLAERRFGQGRKPSGRLGRAGPLVAALAAAGLIVVVGWLVGRLLQK